MIFEIPECRRCFCLPVRYGIIILGYIYLIISILMLLLEVYICHWVGVQCAPTLVFYKGVAFFIQSWLAYLMYVADFIFNIILLVGAHKKDVCLLTAYFYYGITTSLASFIMFFMITAQDFSGYFDIYVTEAAFVACTLGIQVFQLLLVRSETRKLKQRRGLRFVNHTSEIFVDVPIAQGNNPF